MKKTLQSINEILNKTRNEKLPEYLIDEGKHIKDKTGIAEKINSFFTNIGSNLAHNIKQPPNDKFTKYLTSPKEVKFKFESVSEQVIDDIINNLNSENSSGHDNISTILLQHLKPVLI